MKTTLSTHITVSAQTVLTSTLLCLPASEVEEAVRRELQTNPALERLAPDERRQPALLDRASAVERGYGWQSPFHHAPAYGHDGDDRDPFDSVPAPRTSADLLLDQAALLAPAGDMEVVAYLIQSLDRHGFLRVPETDLARDLGTPLDRIRRGVAWVQQLDPPGIGARDLRECFLLQCDHLAAQGVDCTLTLRILHAAWDCFLKQRWECVSRMAGISREELERARQFMRANLYPYPRLLLAEDEAGAGALGRPDLIVHRSAQAGGARHTVEVAAAELRDLRISETFRASRDPVAEDEAPLAAAEREWIDQAIERARLFIGALERRRATLRRIGEFVVAYQAGFFEHGPAHLRPLTRAAVAAALGLHESTVSRAVGHKVIQMPDGRLIDFGGLFDRSLAAKEAIRRLVRAPGKPLSDREIVAQLQTQSFLIARRTVSKYRAEMGIPAMGDRQRAGRDA
jgi:RNA polymerase sigma-54 factor